MRVFRHDRFFDRDTCLRIRHALDVGDTEPAEILADAMHVVQEVRRTAVIDVDDATLAAVEAAFDDVGDRIAAFFGTPLAAREGPSFLRYSAGGFYRPHRDRAQVAAWPEAARRRIAVVLFLNDDFEGGVLQLLTDEQQPAVRLHPSAGTLVAFDAATLHEVLPVERGVRDTIVDWFYER